MVPEDGSRAAWTWALPPLLVALLLIPAFALGVEEIVLGVVGLCCFAALSWWKPVHALLVLLLAMPLAPKIPLPIGNLYISTILVMAFVVLRAFKEVASPAPLRFPRTPLSAPLLFFAAVLTLSVSMNAAYLIGNREQLLRFVQFLFYLSLFFLAAGLTLETRHRRWIVGTVLATGVLEGAIAVWQWVSKRGFFTTGTFDHQHNHLAAFLVFTGLLLMGAILEARSARSRLLYLCGIGLIGFGLVFSFSRTGYIAIGAGMLCFLLLGIAPRKKLAVFSVLLSGALLAYLLVPASVASRAGTIASVAAGKARDISFSIRLEMWSAAIEAFKKSPLLGAGAMKFELRDNYFVKTLAESGAMGMIGLLWVIVAVLLQALRSSKVPEKDRMLRGARIGFFPAAFAILVIFNMSGDFMNLHRLMGVFWVLSAVPVSGGEREPGPNEGR